MSRRIYLDNAATSWPKPDSVYVAVDHYQRRIGSPAGRGSYEQAAQVERGIRDARKLVADLIHAESADRILFTYNGTDSLNLALHGLLHEGDHVITSVVEHNSVLRPLRHLEETRSVQVTRVACDEQGAIDPDDIRRALRKETRLIALVHASNVTGRLQPLESVGAIAKSHDVPLLVDAAQSAGHVALNVQQMGAQLLAAPGHKGLLGPLGTGILYIAPGIERRLKSFRQGGTGSRSDDDHQPDDMPDKYEAGNLNVPGILGLRAGARYILETGLGEIREHEARLTQRLLDRLGTLDGVRVYAPTDPAQRVGVISFALEGYDSREVANLLDSSFGIQLRAGYHCAPLLHRTLQTTDFGGLVRASPGIFNTEDEIDQLAEAVEEILQATCLKHGETT